MPSPKQRKPDKKKRMSRAKQASGLPKGAYRVPPTDSYVLDDSNYTKRADPKSPKQHVVVRPIKRSEIDLRRIARAYIAIEVHNMEHRRGKKFGPDSPDCHDRCEFYDPTVTETHWPEIEGSNETPSEV